MKARVALRMFMLNIEQEGVSVYVHSDHQKGFLNLFVKFPRNPFAAKKILKNP